MVNKPGAKFCGSCGNKLSGAPAGGGTPRPVYTPGGRRGPSRVSQPPARKPSYSPPRRVVAKTPVQKTYMPPAPRPAPVRPVQKSTYSAPRPISEEVFPMDLERSRDEEVFDIRPSRDEEAFYIEPSRDEEVFDMDLTHSEDEEAFKVSEREAYRTGETGPTVKSISSGSGSFLDNIFSTGDGAMEMFIMKEILSPPIGRRRRRR